MNSIVMCIAHSRTQTDAVVAELQHRGFGADTVSVLFSNDSQALISGADPTSRAPEIAAAGAGFGGMVGGAVGLLAGLVALAIPGVGAFLAVGPLLGALTGAAAGASVGGIAGALLAMGMPEGEAARYQTRVKNGDFLISVHVSALTDEAKVQTVFRNQSADDITTVNQDHAPVNSLPPGLAPAPVTPVDSRL